MRELDKRRERIIARNKARRVRELKNRVIMFVSTVCLVIIFSVCLGSFLSEAKENKTDDIKCFKSVMVEYGENFENVVERCFDEVHYSSVESFAAEIIRINSFDENATEVAPGQFFIVPYYVAKN